MNNLRKIRVLCVDDSALIRDVLTKYLSSFKDIEVVGTAPNPFIARDKILELKPDVMTLDIEMPRMDGVEFLQRLIPQYPIPVVVFSSLTPEGGAITLNALDAGAIDFVTKPGVGIGTAMLGLIDELADKIRTASKVNRELLRNQVIRRRKTSNQKVQIKEKQVLKGSTDKVIAVGASTGGTEAFRQILEQLPLDLPGIVVVQHLPPVMTHKFAQRLNEITHFQVKEAKDGDRILNGHVLIAEGGKHLAVERSGGIYVVRVFEAEKVMGHSPSVQVLFDSVAKNVGSNALGVMLTGMGKDGAPGMLAMRNAGARTITQDEASSVVWGMPGEAHRIGAAEYTLALDAIPAKITQLAKGL